ncbi:hypothetical protein ACLKA6_015974 [Drosophila palustris]
MSRLATATPMRATVFNRGNNHNCDLYDSVDATMPQCHNATMPRCRPLSHQWSRRFDHIGDESFLEIQRSLSLVCKISEEEDKTIGPHC